jgi:demethylmenaquinone methyltransferase / 2-methoxy-6-polyprenyl-1,4-benzoquinol methylase
VIDKSGDRVRQMFAQIAPQYDRLNHLLSLNIDRRWRSKTVRLLGPFANDSMLDVCTGTGDLAIEFARRTNCPTIIAADFCAPMLDIARTKQLKHGLDQSRLSFIEADTQQLPFEDNSFDVVTVAFGLRNVSNTQRGLQELIRVCKPNGRVGILEFSKPTAPGLRQIYGFYFRNVLPRIGQRLAKNHSAAYEYLPASVGEFPSGQDLIDLMIHNGYVDVKQYPLTFGVASLYIGAKG